jgi:outer membrane receptor protein involved in Fe transport
MKVAQRRVRMAAGLMASAAALISASFAAPAVAADIVESGGEDVIVVTATRRTERLEDVPYNIQAVVGEDLARIGATAMADYVRNVPGLSFIDTGPTDGVDIVLRGLRTGGNSAYRTTAIYVDEVEIPTSLDPSILDIERVEVLRGPQGTLYGSGAIGGAIRYISAKPDFTRVEGAAGGEVSATRRGGVNWLATGMLNLPLVTDKLALRMNVGYFRNDGYIDNILLGRDDVNTERTFSTRVVLAAKPSETLGLALTYYSQLAKFGASSSADADLGPYANAEYFQGYTKRDQHLFSLTASLDLDGARLTSSTSYRYAKGRSLNDNTTYIRDVIFGSFLLPEELPPLNVATGTRDSGKYWTQEVRLVSDSDSPLSYILGAFYERYSERDRLQETVPLGFEGQDEFEGNIIGAELNDSNEFLSVSRQKFRQWAVFGEIGYALTERWKASVGGRYFDYRSRETQYNIDQFFGFDARNPDGTARTEPLEDEISEGRARDNGKVFRFNTSYDLAEGALAYVTIAEGYRPGGYNTVGVNTGVSPDQFQYKPDSILSYELGAKAALLDRRLFISGSLYYIDWKEIQTSVYTDLGFVVTGNAGKARSRGFELELSTRNLLAKGLSAGFTYSLTDAELKQTIEGLGFKGERMPYVPRHAASFTLDYEADLAAGLVAGFNTNLTHTGVSWSDFGTVRPGEEDLNPDFTKQDGYWLAGASLRIGREPWSVRLGIDNIFDVRADLSRRLFNTTSPYRDPFYTGAVNRPRTVSLGFDAKF